MDVYIFGTSSRVIYCRSCRATRVWFTLPFGTKIKCWPRGDVLLTHPIPSSDDLQLFTGWNDQNVGEPEMMIKTYFKFIFQFDDKKDTATLHGADKSCER